MSARKRKGQMEMFGFAIVVILVSLVLMFVFNNFFTQQPSNVKRSYTQKELSQSFITALLASSTDCKSGIEVIELFEDVATYNSIICENGQLSRDYLNESLSKLFNATLNEWNKYYRFQAYKEEGNPIVYFNNNYDLCTSSRPGWGYVPLNPGTLTVRLDVC